MTTAALLGLAQTGQALALTSVNLKLVTKKKKTAKDFIKVGAVNIVGIPLISATGSLING